MSKIGKFRIEKYEVTLPDGEKATRRQIIYLNKFDQEITREQYEDKPIDSNYMDPTDPVYAVSQLTFSMDASEDWSGCEGVTNRFIKRAGGNYTNVTPFIAWQDCVLVGVAISSSNQVEWDAVIFVEGKEAIRLSNGGQPFAIGRFSYKITEKSRISIYVEGEDVQNPGVQLIFSAILPQMNSDEDSVRS